MNKTDVSWLGALAFCLCLLGAVLSLISGDYAWFIIDVLVAALNMNWAREWFKSKL
jgi:hypothetical protein